MDSVSGASGVDPSLVSSTVADLPGPARIERADEVAKRLGVDPSSLALLASNENPLGPSERAVEAARHALVSGHRYPDPWCRRLVRAVAAHHRVSPEQVVVGNGSSEIIEVLVRTFVGPGQTVVSGWPSFAAYRISAQIEGREFLSAPLRRGRLDLAGIAALVDRRAKLVFLSNPNNPTGTYVRLRELAAFMNRVPPETIVVVDEAYADYVEASDYPQAIEDLLPAHPRLVVLRTFSKAYGLAGYRVGYGVMAPNLVRAIHLVRPVFSVSTIAEKAALAALEDTEHLDRSRRLVSRERAKLLEGLRNLGLVPYPSQANFVYVGDLPVDMPNYLENRGILVRGLSSYGLQDAIRISVGSPEAIRKCLDTISNRLKAGEGCSDGRDNIPVASE